MSAREPGTRRVRPPAAADPRPGEDQDPAFPFGLTGEPRARTRTVQDPPAQDRPAPARPAPAVPAQVSSSPSGPTPSRLRPSGTALVAGLGVASAVAVVAGYLVLGSDVERPAGDGAAPAGASGAVVTGARPETALVTSATAVLEAWSHRQLSYPWWWAELRPLLSPGARAAYAHTDPEQLPDLGEVRPVEQQRSGDTATVWFRTDAGRFGVDLSRSADGSAWRAHRILFPGQESMFR